MLVSHQWLEHWLLWRKNYSLCLSTLCGSLVQGHQGYDCQHRLFLLHWQEVGNDWWSEPVLAHHYIYKQKVNKGYEQLLHQRTHAHKCVVSMMSPNQYYLKVENLANITADVYAHKPTTLSGFLSPHMPQICCS